MYDHIIAFQKLNGLTPDSNIGKKTAQAMMKAWGVNREQFSHLMGNLHNETGDFTVDSENLMYSKSGLLKIFPKYFTATTAAQSQFKPQHIANIVYASRMGNGNYASGDGYKFRGRGSLQLTGRKAYKVFEEWMRHHKIWRSEAVTLMEKPDLVATEYFWESALFFFTVNKLWTMARKIDSATIKAIRKKTNGGYIGLAEVEKLTNHYYKLTA